MDLHKRKRGSSSTPLNDVGSLVEKKASKLEEVSQSSSSTKPPPLKKSKVSVKKEVQSVSTTSSPTLSDLHSTTNPKATRWVQRGAKWCGATGDHSNCILGIGKFTPNSLSDAIISVMSFPCSKKGDCEKSGVCVGSCKRYNAYRTAASYLQLTHREILPVCVYLYIESLAGKSSVGFKEQE